MDARTTTRKTAPQRNTRWAVDYEATIRDWWKPLGEEPCYPADRETVFRLLRSLDYEIDESRLAYLVNTIHFESPDEWTARHIVRLIGACEAKRWYRVVPDSRHWAKVTRYARGKYWTQHLNKQQTIDGICKFTVRDLALMLLKSENPDEREQIFTSLEIKLESLGVE